MAGLNRQHQAKVMKDAFSSTEAKGFFHREREKNQRCCLAGCGFRQQGTKANSCPGPSSLVG